MMRTGLVVEEGIEQAHRVRPAADGGDDRVGQAAFGGLHLLLRLLADDRLEIAHHRRIGVRPRHRADAVEGVAHVGHPVAQRVVHRVLQRAAPRGDRDHLGPQKLHAEDVGRLPFDVMRAHVDDALQPELGADRGGGDAVLARAGLGDDPGLAHAAGEDDLAQHVVDLVRAGVVQLVALHVDLGAAQMLGQPLGEIERRGAADIVGPQIVHLGPEAVVGLGALVLRLQLEDQRHQRFDTTRSARRKSPKRPVNGLVGAGHEAVDRKVFRASRNAAIRPSSLTPGALSTPEETSTCRAPVRRTASATFPAVRPPASIHGTSQRAPGDQPPVEGKTVAARKVGAWAGLASTSSWSAARP
jgi:hypothetical protein